MVTILYVIRHGETVGAETRRYKGTIDVPLSEKGVQQIERLSGYIGKLTHQGPNPPVLSLLKGDKRGILKAVYASDLRRAVKSAEIIAKPHNLIPRILPSLRERNFGLWEGMSFDEIREKYPEEFRAWADNPLRFSPMGGESTVAVRERVIPSLEKILNSHQGESIGIVSHGGVNRIILCHLLGMPFENIFRIEQDYGCLNIIELWDTYPVVKLINGVFHG